MMQANPLLPDNSMPEGDRGCGVRLRRAREAAGLTQSDVASRLKMPVSVVQSLEIEDWSRLGAPVFVRGQLRSYSRLLGLMTAPMVAASGVGTVEPPVLVPRTYTPPMQRLAEQLARRLVYVVLTAAIIVPVWLATRPHLGIVAHDSAPLDVPVDPRAINIGAADEAAATQDPRPLVASLAPMGSTASDGELSLRLSADSWVQVTAPDGHLVRKSLVRAGEELRYPLEDVGGVVLGNASAVTVRRNGTPVDLTPYLRSNVARFTVSSAGSLSPVAD
ncbi:helix-turn-helix domain-containing protein [Cognatiluteimonas profundi]|uniref:helix-turn-helix domain-containing protein n=1 Tax=Cognatiluteimonas profundi TaxID=2594501 RepID=UPI001E58D137|nr:helix-turn-helix domain-containing protein [Lysobacter profundi]